MSKEEILKAFEELSTEDQKAVRAEIPERAALSCAAPTRCRSTSEQ
jgi:hypothetical protein